MVALCTRPDVVLALLRCGVRFPIVKLLARVPIAIMLLCATFPLLMLRSQPRQ